MFGPWVHPRSYVLLFELKDCVGDEKLMVRAQTEESNAIVVYLPRAMSSDYQHDICANLVIEVIHEDKLIGLWDSG